ncbi:MAG TPA: L-threonylcarbamoyladenylate synthase [Anaerolineales bacterium]|nr:L-threonylcarbamoyladenylate synthase [Anaerolineales bacterium]
MKRTRVIQADHPTAIQIATDIVQRGGTVVFPTDTVYGLGCSAFSEKAIEQLFIIKERKQDQAIAVLLGSVQQLSEVTEHPSQQALDLAEAHWPGALTLVMPRHPKMPENLSPLPTLGVRIPDHPVALRLLQAVGPMAVTSANLSGKENTTTAEEVLSQLEGRVDLILNGGETPGGVPSTVVNMTSEKPVVLRQGPVIIE